MTCASVHIDRALLNHQLCDAHLLTLDKVQKIFNDKGLRLNVHQSQVCTDSANVMGFNITRSQIHMALAQQGTEQWELPTNAKMIRSFQGFCNFYRGHVLDYTNIAATSPQGRQVP